MRGSQACISSQEIELVREFRIERGVGNVAAGGHVEIVQLIGSHPPSRNVTEMWRAIDLLAELVGVGALERQAREHRHAVIALLPWSATWS